ncbi:MAG: 50S ribosomal protein L10 [Anaerolineae bacterium]|uniref:50S ribosomal protein L10 n=1 Tax=Candidatus Amarolinea dominans TaxID=3140696 RepID=UPI00313589D6|nr:50S ribosomal protein L10 [Anaerolineae bacterium]
MTRLPLTRKEKQKFIDQYAERLQKSRAIVVLRNKGLTVAEITALRKKLRDADATFQVTKNTLFKIALKDSQFPVPDEMFAGMVSVCYFAGPIATSTKHLLAVIKEQKKLELIGALLPDDIFGADEVKRLVDLPTREQLLAQLLGAVQGPATNLVGVLQAPLREIITVLYARSEQAEENAA